jgi:hypothetical protein
VAVPAQISLSGRSGAARRAAPRGWEGLVLTKNVRAIFRALQDFGARLARLTAGDFAREGTFYQMGRPPARIDILMSVAGLRFAAAWRRRVSSDFDGVPASIISRADLISNRGAAGWPQDLIDVGNSEESERIEREASDEPRPPEDRPKGRSRKPRRGA